MAHSTALLCAAGAATSASARTESGVVNALSQALYGYTGAGADVLEHLEREMGINTTFALTCSWRLPKLHVQHAVEFMRKHGRDGFQLAEQSEALPGLIAYNSNFTRYRPSATGDHAVLCRTNKELMRIRMELAKRNIPCHMAGRQDLAKGLFKLLKQLASVSPDEAAAPSECTQWDFLVVALKRVINGESEDACLESGEGSEDEEGGQGGQGQDASGQHKDASELSAAAARRCRIDYAEVMLGMMAEMEATASEPNSRSLKRLRENIAKFREGYDVPQQDDDAPGAHVVRLMTIHKAKGMEFHRFHGCVRPMP
jgi:superfamily I DNA/RNA helicase